MSDKDIKKIRGILESGSNQQQLSEEIADYVDEQRVLALGWATADACIHLDKGKDYREVEVPTILERFREDLA